MFFAFSEVVWLLNCFCFLMLAMSWSIVRTPGSSQQRCRWLVHFLSVWRIGFTKLSYVEYFWVSRPVSAVFTHAAKVTERLSHSICLHFVSQLFQVTYVEPYKGPIKSGRPLTSYEKHHDVSQFMFETPFLLQPGTFSSVLLFVWHRFQLAILTTSPIKPFFHGATVVYLGTKVTNVSASLVMVSSVRGSRLKCQADGVVCPLTDRWCDSCPLPWEVNTYSNISHESLSLWVVFCIVCSECERLLTHVTVNLWSKLIGSAGEPLSSRAISWYSYHSVIE